MKSLQDIFASINPALFYPVKEMGSSVGKAQNFWSGGRGFDPGSRRLLPTGWVGFSIM